MAIAGVTAIARVAQGTGSFAAVGVYLVLVGLFAIAWKGKGRAGQFLADWLPLLALPVLYLLVPSSIIHGDGRTFDAQVQAWDLAIFGTEPARTMAGALPYRVLSEVLHGAYVSYYGIIYVPPLLMYLAGDRESFRRAVTVFTVVMAVCFVVFIAFPVAGPRFEWGAPAGIPGGPIRSLTLALLEKGSARGTAFPSSHIAIALAMSLSSITWRRGFGAAVMGVTILLGAGAVYGGFHYGVDMLTGSVVGAVGWQVGRRVSGNKMKAASA